VTVVFQTIPLRHSLRNQHLHNEQLQPANTSPEGGLPGYERLRF
jgi:hypothetical protein